MAARRTLLVLVLFLIILLSFVVPIAFATLTTRTSSAGPVTLQLMVSPNAIPKSGVWTVTSALFFAANKTRVDVAASVNLTATLSDGTKTVQTKNATDGQTSFTVPAGTVAAQFVGRYGAYTSTNTTSTQVVIPESQGETQAGQAVTAGFSFAAAAWLMRGTRNSGASRVLVAIPGALLGGTALAYLVQEYPKWYGTGWIPEAWYGIPVFGMVVATYVLSGLSAGISKATAKDEPPKPGP